MSQTISLEGLTALGPTADGDNPVDYVFLHGLNGNPQETWTYETKDGSGFFWPRQLLVDIPGCRVLTFGYNALFERALIDNTTNINAIAETLVTQLITNRKGADVDRPLILVAHSLGGLVIKRALCNIHRDRHSGLATRKIKEQNAIYDSVAGIVFMGTPHAGSRVADAARTKLLKAIARATFKKAPDKLISALSAHSSELQDLSDSFENTTIFTQHVIEICTYYETMTQKFAGEEVVPLDLAVLHYLNERKEPIPREHTKMTKFENANDNLYKSVRERLKDMAVDGLEAKRARQATYRILQIPNMIDRESVGHFLSTCGNGALGPPADIRVHSLASCAGQSQSNKMATVTFVNVPSPLLEKRKNKEKQWSIPFVYEKSHGILTVDVQAAFNGFTFLNDVQLDDHIMDVVALPGLGYDPFTSWQYNAVENPFMWLRDSLPELIPGAQISLYGYDVDFNSQNDSVSIQSIATSLISGLRGIGRSALSAKPVVFLAHSLGGIILKQCLIELANSGQSELFMLQTVKTCIFMAVPNCLPDPSELAAILASQRLDGLLKELQAASNVRYLESMSGMLGGISQANGIRLCSGFETVKSVVPAFEKTIEISGPRHKSALLLQKIQSIQEGSQNSDQFPIAKPHRGVTALEPGNQAINTIATLIRDTMQSISAPDVVPNAILVETSLWKRSWTGLVSYFGRGAPAEASTTWQKPLPVDNDDDGTLYHQFLSTLKNHGREREDGISEASQGTFNWIWTNREIGFPAWITNDQPLFWIRGKPGSGKSTLMRHIWDHPNLSELVGKGTQDKPKVKAAFFFDYRGTHLQKSFEGMLHTILLRLLTLEPRLAAILLPEFAKLDSQQRAHFVWTLPKLMKAFEDILVRNLLPVDVLLFIDALDEYDGPPEAIVDFIQSSVQNSHQGATSLKVCFSSREWEAFEQSFSRGPGFRIHEHTKADIKRYILSRLSSDPNIAQRLASGSEEERSDIQRMEKTLAGRANGVFIWVRAVIDEIHRLFSQNTPTSELLGFLGDVPSDLDQLYTDSIKRLPHEFRREAYYMFEIMLKSDVQLNPSDLKEAVSCAMHQNLDACVRAIQEENQLDSILNASDQWVNQRGAGLVEIHSGDYAIVARFIHQTVVDFLSRPGFRGIIFGHAFELPLENGYSLMSKWLLAQAEAVLRATSAEVFEQGAGDPTGFRGSPRVYSNVLALAEHTTGRSMRKFLSQLDIRIMRDELRALGYADARIASPLYSFAAVHGLMILLEEVSCENKGKIPDKEDVSLLHYLCTLADQVAGKGYGPWSGMIYREGHVATTASFLLRRGARLNAKYNDATPWNALFGNSMYSKFSGLSGCYSERRPANALIGVMLGEGQDPNEDVRLEIRRGRRTEITTVKALHIATRDMAEILLRHDAKVNALDMKGRTPLDLACGVGGNPYEVGDHVQPQDAYHLASLLVKHGAKLTTKGHAVWPGFLSRLVTLAPEIEASFSDSFKNPGVIRYATAARLAKRLRARVK